LHEANEYYDKHLYHRHVSKIYFAKTVFCSDPTRKVQTKYNVAVMTIEGELQIRLTSFRRFCNKSELGQSLLTPWRKQYGSFRFDSYDVNSLETCLMPIYNEDYKDNQLVTSLEEWYI